MEPGGTQITYYRLPPTACRRALRRRRLLPLGALYGGCFA